MTKNTLYRRLYCIGLIMVMLFLVVPLHAQSSYRLYFTNVTPLEYDKNFLQQPVKSSFQLFWEVWEESGRLEVKSDYSSLTRFQICKVTAENQDDLPTHVTIPESDTSYTTETLHVGSKYGFIIIGIDPHGVEVASDTAWITPGIRAMQVANSEPTSMYYIKQVFYYVFGKATIFFKGEVYDKANWWGRGSFAVLQWLFIFGIIFSLRSYKLLKMNNIFPLESNYKAKDVKEFYVKNINKKFDNMSFRIDNIKGKEYKDVLERVKSIGESIFQRWYYIIVKNKFDMNEFIVKENVTSLDRIQSENIAVWKKNGSSECTRKIILDIDKQGFSRYPIGKIFQAGLENYEHGGLKWNDVSYEVDRAMENRAESEIIEIERSSKMNWLMNIGTIAPMVGLLGTATGISQAFAMMELMRNPTHAEVTKALAGGIHSALWTTVIGLIIALLFMLIYHYFQHKLDRINAKWQELYLAISELL